MSKPTIITVSGKARHGKDTFANIFKEIIGDKVLKISYANYLKFMAKEYIGWDGKKDKNGRSLLQQLGTEKIRSKHPDFWVDIVTNTVKVLEDDYEFVIIPDCRFPNEITKWKDLGYNVISVLIIREEYKSELTQKQEKHDSETALGNFLFDRTFSCKDIPDIREAVLSLISSMGRIYYDFVRW